MAATEEHGGGRTGVRVAVFGSGEVNVVTGLPVLDHLLTLLAQHASFDLALEVAAGASVGELAGAGRALGAGLAGPLRMPAARGLASATVPAEEALAHVVLEAAERPLVVSNVDLTAARLGGMETDLVASVLREVVDGASLTLHVRLINGSETRHVLEAIFKTLGVALAQACRPRRREDA